MEWQFLLDDIHTDNTTPSQNNINKTRQIVDPTSIYDLFNLINKPQENKKSIKIDKKEDLKSLLQDKEIAPVLWDSLTSNELSPRAVRWLEEFPRHMRKLGNPLTLPDWWDARLS